MSGDVGAQVKRAGDIKDRLTAVLNASGEFWVEASEIDGGTDVRLAVSDRRNGGPWITVIAETGEDQDETGRPTAPAKHPVLTSKYVFDVLYSAGFTPRGNGEPGFTTGWYCDALTVDHVGADLPVHGPLEGPRAIVADYARTLDEAGFDTHITVNTVLVRKKAAANPAPAGEE